MHARIIGSSISYLLEARHKARMAAYTRHSSWEVAAEVEASFLGEAAVAWVASSRLLLILCLLVQFRFAAQSYLRAERMWVK
jgi:hypothetical protein